MSEAKKFKSKETSLFGEDAASAEALERLAMLRIQLSPKYSAWLNSAEEHINDGHFNLDILQYYSTAVPLVMQREKNRRSEFFRRIGNAFCLFVTLPMWLPLGLIAALAVKLESRGPVFYKQLRMGLNGVPFWVFKFRTMYEGSETKKPKGIPLFKYEDDPRVTRVGRVLRRRKLDEIPQLLNVIRGEMSVVGPRPLSLSDSLSIPRKYFSRFSTPPGITGLWQVRRPFTNVSNLKLALDCLYAKKQSTWLDTVIIFATISVMLKGERFSEERVTPPEASQGESKNNPPALRRVK